jgi:signal peptidase I
MAQFLRTAFVFLATFLGLQIFVARAFYIPSGSMQNTMLVNDYVLVTTFSYGFSRFSLPRYDALGLNLPELLPPGDGRLPNLGPARGDVVVFRHPAGDADIIKRVVGLPGDRIQMIGGVLHLNGQAVQREPLGQVETLEDDRRTMVLAEAFRETLPGGASYVTLDLGRSPLDDTRQFLVPAGNYFMMGDNRDRSGDSRVMSDIGFVPAENIVGRAQVVFASLRPGTPIWMIWRWPFDMRWSRIGTSLR